MPTVLMRRPGFGTQGKKINLLLNSHRIDKPPSERFYQYDVSHPQLTRSMPESFALMLGTTFRSKSAMVERNAVSFKLCGVQNSSMGMSLAVASIGSSMVTNWLGTLFT